LRVGVIGIGLYAASTHVPQLRATGKAEVVAISRRSPERLAMAKDQLQVAAAYTNWREMLDQEQLDAVVVSTANHMHVEPTLAALAKGLHVMVEKPLALTSKDAWAMVDAARTAQKILMVGYGSRLEGIWQKVKNMIASGELGQLRQVSLALCAYRRWKWENTQIPDDVQQLFTQYSGMPEAFFVDWGLRQQDEPTDMGGSSFVDLGTHAIDRLLWLAGAPPSEVMAFAEKAGTPFESFINVQARLANGVLFSLSWADAVPRDLLNSDEQLMMVGDAGVLMQDMNGTIWLNHNGERTQVEDDLPTRTVADAFVAAILDNDPAYPQAHEAAYAVDFIEAVARSIAERRVVRVERV